MRRLVLHAYCGVEWNEDRREVEAVFSNTITIGAVTRNLDLCEKHVTLDIRTLETYLQRYGTKIDVGEMATQHRQKKVTPPPPEEPNAPAHKWGDFWVEKCDVAGCQDETTGKPYETPPMQNPRAALGVHKRMRHNIAGASPASVRARRLRESAPA